MDISQHSQLPVGHGRQSCVGRLFYHEFMSYLNPVVLVKNQVTGSSGIPYICLVGLEYCECPAYRYSGMVICLFITASVVFSVSCVN